MNLLDNEVWMQMCKFIACAENECFAKETATWIEVLLVAATCCVSFEKACR